MKFRLSALTLSMLLSCAGPFAIAQSSTVTVSQSGTGNTGAAEQSSVEPGISATITQTGTNNHVGGPGGTTAGIVQSNGNGIAQVSQTGSNNNVGIVQDGLEAIPSIADIVQAGNANSAVTNQSFDSGIDIHIRQNGSGNAANISQGGEDSVIRVTQNGTSNNATVVGEGTTRFGQSIEQNGDGNTVTATAINADSNNAEYTITQTGAHNNAIANQTSSSFSLLSIRQLGAGNQSDITQTGDLESGTINQNGSANLASINQARIPSAGPHPGNTALITQVGNNNNNNNNNATVRQVGDTLTATVSQIGAGNYANVYQH
jgi:hypothetical protein